MIPLRGELVFPGTVFLVLGIAFVWCAVKMVKGNRDDILVSAPVRPEQEIRLPAAGAVLLLLESPRMATDYRAMQVELEEKQSGQKVTMNYSLMTAQGAVYGLTTVKVPFGRLSVRPGAYIARIHGLQAGHDYSGYRLMISRPYIGRMTLQIIALVLCGAGMLGSLIWAAWLAGLMKHGTTAAVAG
jgi:hypothetical protein